MKMNFIFNLEYSINIINNIDIFQKETKLMSKFLIPILSKIYHVAVALLLGTALLIPAAHADPAVSNTKSKKESTYYLAPIKVTARKFEEDVQEVPISITVIDENAILNTGLDDMEKVIQMTPGLNATRGAPQSAASAFNIRGVGAMGGIAGWEDGTISLYLDGVPIPTGQIDSAIFDASQIEVLRGPQGTLYGKTSLGGAINIISNPPSDFFEGSFMLGAGNEGTREIQGMVTGPLVKDKINARLFINAKTQDSILFNTATDERLGDIQNIYARAIFDADWSENFKSHLFLNYGYNENDDAHSPLMEKYNNVSNRKEIRIIDNDFGAGLVNTIELNNNLNLSLVTGFNYIKYDQLVLDVGVTRISHILDDEIHLNQEIRLDGTADKLQYTAGLFALYFKRNIDFTDNVTYYDNGEQSYTNFAAFGESTYSFTDQWKFTAGLRLNHDTKTVDEKMDNLTKDTSHTMDESKSEIGWNGRAILSYLPTKNHTIFASLSRGYKPGGYQQYHTGGLGQVAKNTPDYEGSTSIAGELGYKGIFFANRLNLDLSIFYTEITDDQVLGFNYITNEGMFSNIDSRSYGLEIASKAHITENFSIGGNIAFTRAEATEDKEVSTASAGFPTFGIPATPAAIIKKGDSLPYVPEISYNVFAEYRQELPWLSDDMFGFIRANYAWQSETYLDATHFGENKAYGLLGLRLGIENENFRVLGYAENLTNEKYYTGGLGFGEGMVAAFPGRGTEVGLQLSVFF